MTELSHQSNSAEADAGEGRDYLLGYMLGGLSDEELDQFIALMESSSRVAAASGLHQAALDHLRAHRERR